MERSVSSIGMGKAAPNEGAQARGSQENFAA